MNIIHIVESFAGGVYDFLVDLTNGMSEFNHFIIHGKRENTPKDFKKDFPKGTEFLYWKNASREINPKKDLFALKELIDILKSVDNIDIIHLHSSKAGFLGRAAARILGLQNKVIYTSHGVSFLRKDVSSIKKKQFELFEKLASKFGGQVIACSNSEAQEFRKIGIQAKYIFNGVDTNKCQVNQLNKKEDKFIIGTVGRITYQKNPMMFNEIANQFLEYKDIKFVWVGDGELRDELASENIEITGWLNKDDVFKKLAEIDLYISTSLWEGLPLSVLQAMCFRKPLLLSNCVGNVDLVIEGKNGFIFNNIEEATEKIKILNADKKLLEIFGENSFKILQENFTLDKTIQEYKKLYILIGGIT
jgi:glycosyltransferase involved in cell wall biosynthesis